VSASPQSASISRSGGSNLEDHLSRMHAQEFEAVDLVPRKDLERTVRELARS